MEHASYSAAALEVVVGWKIDVEDVAYFVGVEIQIGLEVVAAEVDLLSS